jgi:hypothetical protein
MLHGIDTVREKAKQPLQDSETNIVCVVGTVPTFLLDAQNKTLNIPVPIRNYRDITKFAGANLTNYTMYDALETVLTESNGTTIYMINVFDETSHTTEVEDEIYTPSASKIDIPHIGLTNLLVSVDETEGILNTDYRVINGLSKTTIELVSDDFKNAESIQCSYVYADVTKVTASDIIGSVNENGIRTGSKAIYDINTLYGNEVNIIIAPEYSAQTEVRNALVTIAEDLKARVYLDCPSGLSVNEAITKRNTDLMCSSKNAYMAMPHVYRYNSLTNQDELRPISPVLAGLRVKINKTQDVAKSIDNTKSITITGLEVPVEFILNKENTESNALNGAGIGTVINWKGTYRIWGARNCAYPSEKGIETFDSVIDTANFIEKTIESNSFECVGAKITRAFIDNVIETIKAKFNTWKNPEVGIILDGDVWYDTDLNTSDTVSNGYIQFSYDFCPPSVAEHIRYQSYINIKYIDTALTENQ